MRGFIQKMPVIGALAKLIYARFFSSGQTSFNSMSYWIGRYESGGTSGAGSYNQLAEFKAEFINNFIACNQVESVIEYGCGDGNQLCLAQYPHYIGFDVSPTAVEMCREIFGADKTKSFKLMSEYANETADLTLSLDVIYHLVEDDVFAAYMNRLFDTSKRFVIVYSSNTHDNAVSQSCHVRHRKFSDWVQANKASWKLVRRVPNKYPLSGDVQHSSFADFYIYENSS